MFSEPWQTAALISWCAVSFPLGAVPFSYIIARLWAGIDIREHGSGNPGASNVFRTVGPAPGLIAIILDAGKGSLVVAVSQWLCAGETAVFAVWYSILCGFLSVAGHVWSPFLSFRGGKGVATFLGVFAVLFPRGILVALVVALIVILVFRVFSLGSLGGVIVLVPAYFVFTGDPWHNANWPILALCCLAVLVLFARHVDNIKRLLGGKEYGMRVERGAAGKDDGAAL